MHFLKHPTAGISGDIPYIHAEDLSPIHQKHLFLSVSAFATSSALPDSNHVAHTHRRPSISYVSVSPSQVPSWPWSHLLIGLLSGHMLKLCWTLGDALLQLSLLQAADLSLVADSCLFRHSMR